MNKTQQAINSISRQIYEWGLTTDTSNRYDLPTSTVIDLINKSSWDIEVDKKKLIYYTRHNFITPPKKRGLTSALGGTVGHHKLKVPLMIWYLSQLYKRGFKHDQIRLYVYNYFSDKLPPKPVEDTPMEERILYNLRINNRLFITLPTIEDYTLYTNKITLPCWKLTLINYYKGKNEPFSRILIPKRNLTQQELNVLMTLRTDKQFLKEEGFKLTSVIDGVVNIDYQEDLMIYKKYAMKKLNDSKISYLDLLDKNITYEQL